MSILEGEPSYPSSLSKGAKSFIRAALIKNAASRPSSRELLDHPWIRAWSKWASYPSSVIRPDSKAFVFLEDRPRQISNRQRQQQPVLQTSSIPKDAQPSEELHHYHATEPAATAFQSTCGTLSETEIQSQDSFSLNAICDQLAAKLPDDTPYVLPSNITAMATNRSLDAAPEYFISRPESMSYESKGQIASELLSRPSISSMEVTCCQSQNASTSKQTASDSFAAPTPALSVGEWGPAATSPLIKRKLSIGKMASLVQPQAPKTRPAESFRGDASSKSRNNSIDVVCGPASLSGMHATRNPEASVSSRPKSEDSYHVSQMPAAGMRASPFMSAATTVNDPAIRPAGSRQLKPTLSSGGSRPPSPSYSLHRGKPVTTDPQTGDNNSRMNSDTIKESKSTSSRPLSLPRIN